MRGTGPVVVNGTTLYAYFMNVGPSVRVRVSVDEADRMGLVEGVRARVLLPGETPVDVLVTAANRVPPYVWVHLEPLATRPTKPVL
jgi:hypothetical protein